MNTLKSLVAKTLVEKQVWEKLHSNVRQEELTLKKKQEQDLGNRCD